MVFVLRDRRQISFLLLNEFERINELLFPQKSSENRGLWNSIIEKS